MNSRGEPRNPCNPFSSYLPFVEIATRRLSARRPLGVFLFCFLLRLPLLLSLRHTRYPFERVLPVFTGNRAAVKRSTTRAPLGEGRSSRIAGRKETDKGETKERERKQKKMDGLGWIKGREKEERRGGGRKERKSQWIEGQATGDIDRICRWEPRTSASFSDFHHDNRPTRDPRDVEKEKGTKGGGRRGHAEGGRRDLFLPRRLGNRRPW